MAPAARPLVAGRRAGTHTAAGPAVAARPPRPPLTADGRTDAAACRARRRAASRPAGAGRRGEAASGTSQRRPPAGRRCASCPAAAASTRRPAATAGAGPLLPTPVYEMY
eukprot:10309-Chlamydomonas_euryale.AAC.1